MRRWDSGGHSKAEPPGSIPNPEVKRFSADGSVAIGHVRVGRCQVKINRPVRRAVFLCPCGPVVERGDACRTKVLRDFGGRFLSGERAARDGVMGGD